MSDLLDREFEIWTPGGLFCFGCDDADQARTRASEESYGQRVVNVFKNMPERRLVAQYRAGKPLFDTIDAEDPKYG